MVDYGENFGFSVIQDRPHQQTARVIIGNDYVKLLYAEALHARKQQETTPGFSQGNAPLKYIEQNFRSNLVEHLKEVLFNHCVVHILYDSLTSKKMVIVGDPDLIDIKIEPEGTAEFVFKLANVDFDREQRWKRLHLKPLGRKNYKDLDRQVESFIKEETENRENATGNEIELGDWVHFNVALKDMDNNDLIPGYTNDLWICLEDTEDDQDLQELFIGRQVGETFLSKSPFLQEYMTPAGDLTYSFEITIKERLPLAYFEFDLFNHQFGIQDPSSMCAKLVEVFSTRNDISLRRETIEAVFKLLHKQYFFMLPQHLLSHQQQIVLKALQGSPDYHVYKAQNDFKDHVKALAEKQLKEAIIIDAIAYQEGITVDNKDVCAYLNLSKRPRMKEFLYFRAPKAALQGHEIPQSASLIKRYCLREKTLNFLIKEITRPKV